MAANCTPQAAAGSGTDVACSLRDALAWAALGTAQGVSVSFDSSVFANSNSAAANTILLTAGALNVPANTTISGPTSGSGATQANLLRISGNHSSTVFAIGPGVAGVQLLGLNIIQGKSTQGGGVDNAGTLAIVNCWLSGNAAVSPVSGTATGGGGIFNSGKLTLSNSTLSANSASAIGAAAFGGGIFNSGNLTLLNTTVSGNSVAAGGIGAGGGIYTTNALGSSLV